MSLVRHGLMIGCFVLLSGCSSLAVFETEQQRQARVDAAVQQALARERQGGLLAGLSRHNPMPPADRQVAEARLEALERMTTAIAARLEAIEGTAGQSFPAMDRAAYGPADAPALTAEIDSLQHDVAALTAAIGRLADGDSDSEAVLRARLERLELRTSRIAWPTPSSAVRAVHLASYRTHEAALAGWEVLLNRYRDVLTGETPTLVEVRTVAGAYVRLFAGVGHDDDDLMRIREALRDGGDYAMILPLPGNAGT
ncbi:hypothetical protein T8K17_05610 [Thalassobaculum sp. OXR-137]|uniref:hypothetical protein n=1 Tax=Thalassobaculum sp. OXR-137 TaxID=3100173 RepID=UPI002AC9265A|nr:hypothetical protein [Thalassobaculum sp. OXR-137]WPZ35618.1 hypothetical protein T8K17_05610 [Thalassobaculum sp. OXR-137]